MAAFIRSSHICMRCSKWPSSRDVNDVFVHCFMDGRDTPPESGAGYIEQLEKKMREIGIGKIASLSGRYYAMDRDKRWERIETRLRRDGAGQRGEIRHDPIAAVQASYEHGVTDEFIEPVTIVDERE